MRFTESTPAVLLLQDGTIFHGKALGKIGTHGGEICFNTGMTGYQEIYTDPSYAGQVIINTTAHIGNYGVMNTEEAESNQVQIAGMVCNEFSSIHSRETADGSLQDYLENAVAGNNVMIIDATKNMVHADNKKLVLLQGLEDFIVVDTKDVLMIFKKDKEQEIKEYVAEVKRNKGEKYI